MIDIEQEIFTVKIENIETGLGNSIIAALKNEGWKVSGQYNWLAFDKGIDFDSYTLKKDNEKLYFEWTNWFEWEVQGNEKEIDYLVTKFRLNKT